MMMQWVFPLLARYACRAAILATALGISSGTAMAASGETWLITPDEAALPLPAEGSLKGGPLDIAGPGLDLGPIIQVLKPEGDNPQAGPVEILVRFKPRTAPVNPDSLKVVLMKLFGIDITDRVRPYATPEGINFPEAKIPSGKHSVRLSIADTDGGVSTKEMSLQIK